jgi:4-hydroxy-3-methylbut-2-enyl diphosphate reductase
MGVSLALRQLKAALKMHRNTRFGGRLATLGPVIHNPRVIAEYEAQGVMCLQNADEAHAGDTVLIRAHGVPREAERVLLALGSTVVDATCPKVKQAQLAIAAEREKNGGTLLLYGEEHHPEVQGLISYAGNDAHVFLNLQEIEAITLEPEKEYFLAAQTTQYTVGYAPVCERVKERLGHDVPILNTICDATRKRQAEVMALAEKVDMVVIVGGTNSGNTKRLADIAEGRGVPAVRIEDITELSPEMFTGIEAAGLTAGASTPAAHIDAVEAWLKSL